MNGALDVYLVTVYGTTKHATIVSLSIFKYKLKKNT